MRIVETKVYKFEDGTFDMERGRPDCDGIPYSGFRLKRRASTPMVELDR
jgi:hypothetical protein